MEISKLRCFKNDLAFGLAKELEVVDLLKLNFDGETDIKNTKDLYNDKYYPYDYEGLTTGITFELKSRRIKKYQYDTTILPVNKIRDNQIPPQLFVFNFTDICSFIEYDKEKFSKYRIANVSTQRYGKIDLPTPHYYIPINHLTDLIQIYKT